MSARVTSLAYRRALRLRHQTGGQGSEVEQKLEPIYVELGARGIGLSVTMKDVRMCRQEVSQRITVCLHFSCTSCSADVGSSRRAAKKQNACHRKSCKA